MSKKLMGQLLQCILPFCQMLHLTVLLSQIYNEFPQAVVITGKTEIKSLTLRIILIHFSTSFTRILDCFGAEQ